MSVISVSDLGETVYSDIYFTKADNTWEITVFDNYSGSPSSVPYDLASGDITMGTTTLVFDPVTGAVVSGNPVIITDPSDPVRLDFSNISQMASGPGSAMAMKVNTNLPSDDPILDTAAGELPASSNDPAAIYNHMIKAAMRAPTSIWMSISRAQDPTPGR